MLILHKNYVAEKAKAKYFCNGGAQRMTYL